MRLIASCRRCRPGSPPATQARPARTGDSVEATEDQIVAASDQLGPGGVMLMHLRYETTRRAVPLASHRPVAGAGVAVGGAPGGPTGHVKCPILSVRWAVPSRRGVSPPLLGRSLPLSSGWLSIRWQGSPLALASSVEEGTTANFLGVARLLSRPPFAVFLGRVDIENRCPIRTTAIQPEQSSAQNFLDLALTLLELLA